MALNLPDSPSLNDIYQDSTTGFSFQWDGSIWRSYRVTATTAATDLVDDASPQLGANLDLNSSSITGTGNINITGVVTATSFFGDITGTATTATNLNNQAASYYLDYNNFTNTPTIPTNNNQLSNGAGFITTSFTNTNQLTNGAGFITASDDITGNAATATKLATARTIAGVSFDGTSNISLNNNAITNGAGYITTSFTNTNQLTNGAGFITGTDNTTGTSGGLSGAPSITVTDITAVGNVSIAGTLTYEDVTSIDAIGIVTARTGIDVTTGGIDISSGGANITGVTTSTSFVKSGGTSSQFLKADGSVDSSVYITSADGGNAATLDGIDSSSFLRSDADDSFSGRLTATGSQDEFLKYNGSGTSPYIRMSTNGTSNGYIQFTTSEAWMYSSRRNAGLVLNTNGIQYYTTGGGYNNIWHAGNDGSGSGLDADTLDGIDSSSFLRSDTSDSTSGRLSFTGTPDFPVTIGGSSDAKIVLEGTSNPYIRFREGSTDKAYIQWHSNGFLQLRNQEDTSGIRIYDSFEFTNNGSNFYTIWHAGNDGSGSGLDADTVDGIQASSFLRSDADDSASGTVTFNGRVNIRGHLDLSDSENLDFGSSDDVRIYYYGSDDWLYCNFRSGHGIIFQDNGVQKIIIEDSGVIRPAVTNAHEVGTSSHSFGNGNFQNFTVNSTLNVRGAIDLADNDILRFGSGDDCEMFVNGSHMYMDLNSGIGNFYIRDGTTTRYTFDDNGSFTATGNVTAYSDINLKENIEVIPNALEKVSAIRGVTYDRKDNEELGRQSGVIAQEVEVVLPEVVDTDEDGIKSVAYGNLVGLLIEAVKELKAEVETLKAERN